MHYGIFHLDACVNIVPKKLRVSAMKSLFFAVCDLSHSFGHFVIPLLTLFEPPEIRVITVSFFLLK